MFKFGFQPEELNEEFSAGLDHSSDSKKASTAEIPIPCLAFEEIQPTAAQIAKSPDDIKHGVIIFAGGQVILHLKQDVLIDNLVEDEIQRRLADERERSQSNDDAANRNRTRGGHDTDLIPGVYEGGGKIWECTQDLGDFLTRSAGDGEDDNEDTDDPAADEDAKSLFGDLNGQTVLDLGCGAGILGLLALRAGATVHFQDYNPEIVAKVTIPNALLNTFGDAQSQYLGKSRFFAGDWANYVQVDGPQFDVILTSETIYNPANNHKIIETLCRKLKPGTGVAYLAAKTYYFGVGGGLREFEALLAADARLRSEVVWKSTENVQREILRITHNQ